LIYRRSFISCIEAGSSRYKELGRMNRGSSVLFSLGEKRISEFTVSIVLIISTIIIYRQIQFAKNRELGFNKE
jgi:hypothetical protein